MPKLSVAARTLACSSLIALAAAGSARAAALEQVVPNTIRLLYQEGRYGEFGVSYTDPDQSGEDATLPPFPPILPNPTTLPGNTGDVFRSYWSVSGAYKADLNDRLSYALILDQPLRADTRYGAGTFPQLPPPLPASLYGGSMADLTTYQISGVLAYDVTPSVKVFGGARAQLLQAKAAVSFVNNYSVDAKDKWGYGYLLGAAYERPDIALRVALTYYSKISYDLSTRETVVPFATGVADTQNTKTDVDTPQSVQLDFQTGVAPKTLVFGYVRWVDWSEFNISPPVYEDADRGAPRRSRGRWSTTPTTGGPTTSASGASSPTRWPARSRSPTSRASAAP